MASITQTAQLSIFSLLRSAITSDATLSVKFNNNNIYQFSPKHKSPQFKGFPYMVIEVPTNPGNDFLTLDHSHTQKDFEVNITIVMEYLARDNYLSYANAFVKAIEAYEGTLDTSGYYNTIISHRGASVETDDQKELIVGSFLFTADGGVDR